MTYEEPTAGSADEGQINGLADLSQFKEVIDHGTFGVYCNSENVCAALTGEGDWLSDSSDAFFDLNAEGEAINPDKPSGITVVYNTETVCDENNTLSLSYTVRCDDEMDEPLEGEAQ